MDADALSTARQRREYEDCRVATLLAMTVSDHCDRTAGRGSSPAVRLVGLPFDGAQGREPDIVPEFIEGSNGFVASAFAEAAADESLRAMTAH